MKDYTKEYRARHPEKAKAQNKVADAVRRGKIDKPDACSCCGTKGRIHGHHTDYEVPLQVVWLCPSCHEDAHHGAREKYQKPTPTHEWHKKFQPAPLREASIEKARALRSEGKSYKAIAAEVGATQGTVYKWLNPKESYG